MLFSSRACSNRRSILEPGRGGRWGSGDGSTGGSTGGNTSANSSCGGDVPSVRGAQRSDAVPTDARPAQALPEPPARPALRPASQGRSPPGLPLGPPSFFPSRRPERLQLSSASGVRSPWSPCFRPCSCVRWLHLGWWSLRPPKCIFQSGQGARSRCSYSSGGSRRISLALVHSLPGHHVESLRPVLQNYFHLAPRARRGGRGGSRFEENFSPC